MLYGRVDPSHGVNFVGMRPAFAARTHSRLPVSSCTAEKRRVNRGYDSSEGNRRSRYSSSKGHFTCRPRGAGVFRTPRRQVVGRVSQSGQRRRYRRHLFRPHRIGELRSPELTAGEEPGDQTFTGDCARAWFPALSGPYRARSRESSIPAIDDSACGAVILLTMPRQKATVVTDRGFLQFTCTHRKLSESLLGLIQLQILRQHISCL
jgi:hypothetical protein